MENRRAIRGERAPEAIGPYSQAIQCGSLLFCSGQIAIEPATRQLIEGDVALQTRQVMQNLAAVMEAAGASWAHVVKTTIYLADLDDFAAVNGVYSEFVGAEPPARATVEVSKLPLSALVEIDAIAHL